MAKKQKNEKAADETVGAEAPAGAVGAGAEVRLVRRHLAFGWWSLAIFTTFGLVLEAAHGLKLGWYLDLSNATRRLSFTLGHAHGTLLGLVNIAFAVSIKHATLSPTSLLRASWALRAATILMPLGFVAGGVMFYAGDPGIGIALVPPAALVLVIGVITIARGFAASPKT